MEDPRAGTRVWLAAAVVLAAGGAVPAAADGPVERFAGTYRYEGDLERQRGLIERAIESAIESMGPLRRMLARRKLLANNPPIRTVQLSFADGWVDVRHDDRLHRSPLGGEAAPGESPDGHRLRISHRYENGTLVELFRSKHSIVRVVISLSGDEQELRCAVSITDERLPASVRYRLRFRRVR